MSVRSIKELMLPLSEYAVVDADSNLVKALQVLSEAQKKVTPGRYLNRAVLVRNKKGYIIGKMGHFSFLKAFLRSEDRLLNDPVLHRAGVSDDMVQVSRARLGMLHENIGDDFSEIFQRVGSVKVKDVMISEFHRIDENASITKAIEILVRYQTLSLLVTSGQDYNVIGILRVADIFEELSSIVQNIETSDDKK